MILSNKLPVQDGFLLAFRIKHHPQFRSTLVMMLASEGKPGDAIACRENGIAAYMRYPINDRQLNEAIVAVTGASVDADETPTLVTRHSLREQRKGATILLVDRNRDSQILAAHILGRHDCSVVVAQDLAEAHGRARPGRLRPGAGGHLARGTRRRRRGRGAALRASPAIRSRRVLVAVSLEHSPAFREARLARGLQRHAREALPQGRPHHAARRGAARDAGVGA